MGKKKEAWEKKISQIRAELRAEGKLLKVSNYELPPRQTRPGSGRPEGCPGHGNMFTTDYEVIDRMLRKHCSGAEIAATIGMSKAALYVRVEKEKGMKFGAYMQQVRSEGRAVLRERMFDMAVPDQVEKSSVPLAIFLSKQYLGFSDAPVPQNENAEKLADAVRNLEILEENTSDDVNELKIALANALAEIEKMKIDKEYYADSEATC